MVLSVNQARNIQKMKEVLVDQETGKYLSAIGEWEDIPLSWISEEFIYSTNDNQARFLRLLKHRIAENNDHLDSIWGMELDEPETQERYRREVACCEVVGRELRFLLREYTREEGTEDH